MSEETWQRATSPEQKQERRRAILEAATALFGERPIAGISIGEVAQRAGVAKGSIYRYFATKEEVFLALLIHELDTWFDALDAVLSTLDPGAGTAGAASIVVGTLRPRDTMVRLLAGLYSDIEQNLSLEAAGEFKEWLLARVSDSGAAFEAAMPGLAQGDGGRVVLRLYALVAGLHHMANPVGPMKQVLQTPRMAPLRVDFFGELEGSLAAMLVGMTAPTSTKRASERPPE